MANRDDYANIQVTLNGPKKSIEVHSPYHPEFPKRARELGGLWVKAARAWIFPPTAEATVRDLCVLCYGTDRGQPTKTIPKRERKPRKASKPKGLAAYSADDLLAELRRRGFSVLHTEPDPAPEPDPPLGERVLDEATLAEYGEPEPEAPTESAAFTL